MTSDAAQNPLSDLEVPPDSVESDVRPEARSRSSFKRERVGNESALTQLAHDLLPLKVERLRQLGISDAVIDAVVDALKIKSYVAKERQMRLIRARLRDTDWMALRARLDQARAGYIATPGSNEGSAEAQTWAERLLIQGDLGIALFIEDYPDTDRSRLRQLVRNTQNSAVGRRPKARQALVRAVTDALSKAKAP